MNSKKIQREEEHKCASLEERIAAAKKILKDSSYRVGFHFDPIIDYPGWENDYEDVLDELFSQIPEDRIAWMSLGCLRMMPALKPIMQHRFSRSDLLQAEWIRGMDGKMRYFKPRRIEIYKKMAARIRRKAPHMTLYLSMESPEVWRHVFGFEPTRKSVCDLLDRAGKAPRGSVLEI
jgi:spore photoproduct lyase